MTARLRHYACGSTGHDLDRMFRGAPAQHRRFPSGAFLYDAAPDRRVLFDTGYATGKWGTGVRGAVYRRLLPPRVADEDDIAERLRSDGVDPATVTHVVLSHLHPDHIGGVRRFRSARFVLAAPLLRTLAAARLRDGVLPALLPDWFPGDRPLIVDPTRFTHVDVAGVGLRAHDLFDDGSYLLVDLPGHAAGHLGALVEGRVLLAGDAAWGVDLIADIGSMRTLPRAVQHDYDAYRRTGERLAALAGAGVRIVCSHDAVAGTELLG